MTSLFENPFLLVFALSVADMLFPVGLFFWGIPLLVAVLAFFEAGSITLLNAIAVCFLGNFLTSQFNFQCANWLIRKFPNQQSRLEHPFLQKCITFHGASLVFPLLYICSRFVSLTRPVAPVLVGTIAKKRFRFFLVDAVASLTWVTVWCVIAAYAPDVIREIAK